MEEIKSKVMGTVNTFKEKIDSSQELNQLKSRLKILEEERTSSILTLGEAVYESHRRGEKIELNNLEEIIAVDKEIHKVLKEIEKMEYESIRQRCECGNQLSPEDKFCKECGSEVITLEKIIEEDMRQCPICETSNHVVNDYCIACGNKLD